jgi:hypothetical protein
MTATADDPIRAEVERVLQAVIDVTLAAPVRVATAVPRCVRRRVDQLAPLVEPLRVVRSLIDLVGAGRRNDGPAEPEPDRAVIESGADADEPDVEQAIASTSTHLPIDDYESLAASQVVDRLPTLTPAELETVRHFETAHRGRRTVLGRIEQLLA